MINNNEEYQAWAKKVTPAFEGLDIGWAVGDFLMSCDQFGCNPDIGVEAIKEFSDRLNLKGMNLYDAWEGFAEGARKQVEAIRSGNLTERMVKEFVVMNVTWLIGAKVADSGDDVMKVINLRL